MTTTARRRRTALFVGALTDGWDAAVSAAPDTICIDLEDAVPPNRKAEGRAALRRIVQGARPGPDTAVMVRINWVRSPDGLADLLAALEIEPLINGLLLPKVATADEVRWIASVLDEAQSTLDLQAIIESPEGLENCVAIAAAHPRLAALYFGGFDLSTALGCAMEWQPLLYARSRVVHAAAGAGIAAIDSPYPNIGDNDGLRAAAVQARDLGMAGKTAKHASQLAAIAEVFTPDPAEVARAHEIIKLFEADPTAPLIHEGRLVELPTVKRLRRLAGL